MVFRPPASALIGQLPDRRGYNFDGCAPETFRERVSVKQGKLTLPDGLSYQVLVLPERDTMTPELLRKVRDLVHAGATVIGPRPLKAPGLQGYPHCDDEVARLAAEIWGPCDGRSVKSHVFGQGRVVWDATVPLETGKEPAQYGDYAIAAGELAKLGVAPDFESDGPVRYTHRRVDGREVYFVANREARPVEARCVFRVAGKIPELWDPLTGERQALPEFSTQRGRTTVPLRFEAEQSFFVVFRDGAGENTAGGSNFPKTTTLAELAGPWEVSFDPKWNGPEKISFAMLDDWSKRPEPGIKYYSGLAVYRQRFDLPPAAGQSRATPLWLDLGVVKAMAGVRLNGRDLGAVWCAPWRVDISAAVKPGANELEITVANLWPNRLIGDAALPAEQRRTWTSRNPYKPDAPLLESGLLGPVTIQRAER